MARDAIAADPDLALAWPIEAGDQVEQRRLARTRRSHQAEELAFGHLQVQVVEHVDLLAAAREVLVHTTDADNRFGGH